MADITLGPGNDTFVGPHNSTTTIFGDLETLQGAPGVRGGDDTITGGANSTNTIYGDAKHMVGAPTGGEDTLIGGKGGTNFLVGDAADLMGAPKAGNDHLISAPNTTDHMWGDFVDASGGNPTFGQDTFVFGPNNGNDFIYDFSAGGVADTIEFSGLKGGHAPTSFADLTINVADTTGPSGVPDGINDSVIQLSNNDSVTVVDFTGLTANDFLFT